MRRALVAAGLLCVLFVAEISSAAVKQPLTVARAIETTRIMTNMEAVGPANPDGAVSLSPSGKRYVLRLVRGDVARNGVWMEILTGSMVSLETATPKSVARLFTSGLGAGFGAFGSDMDVMDGSPLRWLNDDEVVLLWSDEHSVRQATRVNLQSGKIDRLTSSPTPLGGFDVSANGAVLYYAKARPRNSTPQLEQSGFVVPPNVDAYGLFHRNLEVTAYDVAWNTQWFIQERGQPAPRALAIAGREIDLASFHRVQFAPDGRTAAVTSAPQRYSQEWSVYSGVAVETGFKAAQRDVRNPMARILQQLYVVDLTSGASRPLWNTINAVSEVRWSGDGRSLLLAPTYLPPPDRDPAGLAGYAAAVVEVASGKYQRLPVDLRGRGLPALRWVGAHEIEMETRSGDDVQRVNFRKEGAQWRLRSSQSRQTAAPPIRVEIRQDLNTPPRLYAVELENGKASGREALIADPNADLRDEVALGKVEIVEGKLGEQDSWRGYLIYPVNYQQGRRYPLLIQSVYGAPVSSEFTLYGLGNLGPPLIACYPGQVMAGRDIAVLHVNVHMGKKFGTVEEAETRKSGLTAAAEFLIERGLVEPTKVGLAGFSRNGWYAEYSLTHGGFPYAAAIAADNWDPSYTSTMLFGDFEGAAAVNGAPPFGEGLHKWLEKAPAFNADRIATPLMKIEQSTAGLFGVMTHWELVARMRYLGKPLEFYVMPDVPEHGSHNTQNPGQVIAVQQRAVDWFDFWLNGREDPDERKAEQYAGWRQLRIQHQADPVGASTMTR
jgi:dipeptidyl aminopeptidase/acylaminoacyl peptidase